MCGCHVIRAQVYHLGNGEVEAINIKPELEVQKPVSKPVEVRSGARFDLSGCLYEPSSRGLVGRADCLGINPSLPTSRPRPQSRLRQAPLEIVIFIGRLTIKRAKLNNSQQFLRPH